MSLDDIGRIKSLGYINIELELPSGWVTRELISIIDEYVMERMPLILNEAFSTIGLEASVKTDENECDIEDVDECDPNTFIVELYSGDNLLFKLVYSRKIGDNTYYLFLKRVIKI